jgi:hypothetical protein
VVLRGFADVIAELAFDDNGDALAVRTTDGRVAVFGASDGAELWSGVFPQALGVTLTRRPPVA